MPYALLAVALLISCSTYPEAPKAVLYRQNIINPTPLNYPNEASIAPCSNPSFADERETILHKLDCLTVRTHHGG
ncbi:MAG TPA: hypothetical protein VLZ54_11890 [Arenibacter sp.]|nr:hypothetical protein [Arenibacter sp.]